jgi:hypothetical protein
VLSQLAPAAAAPAARLGITFARAQNPGALSSGPRRARSTGPGGASLCAPARRPRPRRPCARAGAPRLACPPRSPAAAVPPVHPHTVWLAAAFCPTAQLTFVSFLKTRARRLSSPLSLPAPQSRGHLSLHIPRGPPTAPRPPAAAGPRGAGAAAAGRARARAAPCPNSLPFASPSAARRPKPAPAPAAATACASASRARPAASVHAARPHRRGPPRSQPRVPGPSPPSRPSLLAPRPPEAATVPGAARLCARRPPYPAGPRRPHAARPHGARRMRPALRLCAGVPSLTLQREAVTHPTALFVCLCSQCCNYNSQPNPTLPFSTQTPTTQRNTPTQGRHHHALGGRARPSRCQQLRGRGRGASKAAGPAAPATGARHACHGARLRRDGHCAAAGAPKVKRGRRASGAPGGPAMEARAAAMPGGTCQCFSGASERPERPILPCQPRGERPPARPRPRPRARPPRPWGRQDGRRRRAR